MSQVVPFIPVPISDFRFSIHSWPLFLTLPFTKIDFVNSRTTHLLIACSPSEVHWYQLKTHFCSKNPVHLFVKEVVMQGAKLLESEKHTEEDIRNEKELKAEGKQTYLRVKRTRVDYLLLLTRQNQIKDDFKQDANRIAWGSLCVPDQVET
ncbi:hypothetical protein RUM43_010805 [Polyplax serrata]|uniref:Uncharacterized protein n=1 Tax=Polyplax serrata TaxID=468196 RepID=A0AAN8NKX3_POLSC